MLLYKTLPCYQSYGNRMLVYSKKNYSAETFSYGTILALSGKQFCYTEDVRLYFQFYPVIVYISKL